MGGLVGNYGFGDALLPCAGVAVRPLELFPPWLLPVMPTPGVIAPWLNPTPPPALGAGAAEFATSESIRNQALRYSMLVTSPRGAESFRAAARATMMLSVSRGVARGGQRRAPERDRDRESHCPVVHG